MSCGNIVQLNTCPILPGSGGAANFKKYIETYIFFIVEFIAVQNKTKSII